MQILSLTFISVYHKRQSDDDNNPN